MTRMNWSRPNGGYAKEYNPPWGERNTGGKRPCLALTKKGTPCQGGAQAGYDRCGPHLKT